MAWLRGNPGSLLIAFFTLAVFFTGGLYSVSGRARFGGDPFDTLTVLALGISLLFVLVILMRILWVTARSSEISSPSIRKGN